jgi:nitroreductase
MDFHELVAKARSFRRYDPGRPITTDVMRELVDLVRKVPSGANSQPLRYRIVSEQEERSAVFSALSWAGALPDWEGPQPSEQPTGYIVVCSDAGKPSPSVDVGIACQTLQLAATVRGFGACMLGAIDRPAIKQTLDLPDAMEVRLVLALGTPSETVVLEPLPKSGTTAYWRTEDDVHHVPKRALDEVLL